MAAKAVKNSVNNESLTLGDVRAMGQKQLRVEQQQRKKKTKTPEEKQLRQLKKAVKKLQR